MKYPKSVKEGNTIGVCAPSAGVGYKEESFDCAMNNLKDAGFKIVETESVRSDDYPSAPADVRGREFNSLYKDDNIDMVMCASGGDFTMEMLPIIDQELVKSNPKWFAGYSDPTSIEMLLTTKLDIATIYGINAGSFDWLPLHEYHENAIAVMKGDIPVQHSYDYWASQGFNEETERYEMDEPVEWMVFKGGEAPSSTDPTEGENYGLRPAQDDTFSVSGRLIGGCSDVIDWIAGTPYEDLEGFCERYKDDGFIWFFDNYEMDPLQLMYSMRKLKYKGVFDNARAVIFGRTLLPGEATDEDYLELLERVFGDMDLYLIWNADIGHTKPSLTLINGAIGRLEVVCGEATLSMELK